ncbi:MAG: diguanylate cyclase [Glaciecola sp.]
MSEMVNVKNKNMLFDKLQGTGLVLSGVALQCLLLLYAAWIAQSTLIIICTLILIAWAVSFALIVKGRINSVAYINASLFFLQLCLLNVILGSEAGTHLLFWPLACIFIANPRVGLTFSFVFGLLCIVAFIEFNLLTVLPSISSTLTATLDSNSAQLIKLVSVLVGGAFLVYSVITMKVAFQKKQKQLYKLAHIDTLTGLYNRRYFEEFMLNKQHSVVPQQGYCLVLGDVDHFKQINDSAGDLVLYF